MTKCRCCNQEMASYVQSYDAKYNIPDMTMVTCWNEECQMEGMTLGLATYAERDLTDYLQTERKVRDGK